MQARKAAKSHDNRSLEGMAIAYISPSFRPKENHNELKDYKNTANNDWKYALMVALCLY